jgi:F-box protein 21
MLPQLPLDVLVNVLSFLPAVRSRRDQSTFTLAACLRTNTILREAASLPALWKSHYQRRYEHCDPERERIRREALGSHSPDWCLLYAARRRIDNVAIKHLDNLLRSQTELRRTGECILDLSMDVWDVLEVESRIPPDEEEGMPQHAFTRSFWASSLLRTLTRSRAVLLWRKFWLANVPDPTFEDTMNFLSGFFGYTNERVRPLSGIAEATLSSVCIRSWLSWTNLRFVVDNTCANKASLSNQRITGSALSFSARRSVSS